MRSALRIAVIATMLGGALAACSSPPTTDYLVVSIAAPPAVHDVEALKVTVTVEGVSISNDISFANHSFPATFAIDPNGHTGDLLVDIKAFDRDGLLVGRGTKTPQATDLTATIQLDTTDFVVNTDVASDQYLSYYPGEHGFQLAATSKGDWTAVYREKCDSPCQVQARRFDATGAALDSQIAAGKMSFAASENPTTSYTTPSVAASDDTSLVVWNANDPTTHTLSINCRAFDANGGAKSSEVVIQADPGPYLLSATKLSNQNFAIAWDSNLTTKHIRGAIVKPDCSMVTPPTPISTVTGFPNESAIAASADRIMYSWILDGNVRTRIMSNANAALTTDTQLVAKTTTEQVAEARVVGTGGGNFVLVTRWTLVGTFAGPGHLDYVRVSPTGVAMGSSVRLSTRSGSDSESSESFGVAARADGTVLVVWHSCGDNGDGSQCGVFGQLVDAGGQLSGGNFLIPTTTAGDQLGPSVAALPDGSFAVAWTDMSGVAPDTSGAAVRARIVYPEQQSVFQP